MLREYSVSLTTTGKIHVTVRDSWTHEVISTGIWSAGEIPAAIGFLRDHLEEDAGHFVPTDPKRYWLHGEDFETMREAM